MNLEDRTIKLKDVYLDPYNPRFLKQDNIAQELILDKILSSKSTKELLSSMKQNIRWINKIVVIHKSNFTDVQKAISGITDAEFLVVEGNSRLACLKSGKISGIDDDFEIPILVASKDEDESEDDFRAALRVTQGIANVMVVKQWSVISKARHLYNMYIDLLKKTESNVKPHDLYRKLSVELGISTVEVRQSVIRYEFYKTISDISDSIPEEHWGYLEAFDRNKELREKFGMSSDTNTLNLDEDEEGLYEEILKEIPSLIKKAYQEGIFTKNFRDMMQSELADKTDAEDILEMMNNMTSTESDVTLKSFLDTTGVMTEQENWQTELEKVINIVQSFPNIAVWASEQKQNLERVRTIINKHLEILAEQENENS